jgi:molybdopterin synthase catalytic subunit
MIQLTTEPINTDIILQRAGHPAAGAVVLFLGTTRELTDQRQTVALDYEAYVEMAQLQLAELESQARRRWPVIECIVVHRLGRVPIGEASVAIAVSTPHRADAFAAGQWLIDSLKRDVPIHVPPHRPTRPHAHQPAHQRDRPLQHPLLLLHAGRKRAVPPAA